MAQFEPDIADLFKGNDERMGSLERRATRTPGSQELLALIQSLQEQQDLLQEQVDYQATLRTYKSSDADDAWSTTTGGGIIVSPVTDPEITFTLEEPMVVAITLRANASLTGSGLVTSSFLNANAILRFRVDGDLSDAYGNSYNSQSVPNTGDGSHGFASVSLIEAQDVVTLDAGEHTVNSYYTTQIFAASGSVRMEDQALTVQILNRPEPD